MLGIAPDAGYKEARTAYRRLARRLHPDAVGNDRASVERLTEITDAWRWYVEREAGRVAPDATAGRTRATSDFVAQQMQPLSPPRVPWRFLMVAAIIAIVVAVVADATTTPPKPGTPDQILTVGSCVNVDAQLQAVEVSCAAPHEATVGRFLATDQNCPLGMEPRRDKQGMGLACLVRVGETTTTG